MDLPLPIATLARRAADAESAKDRHDHALKAWEASVHLGVAARRPPGDDKLARPTLGILVGALGADATRVLRSEPLRAVYRCFMALAHQRATVADLTAKRLLDGLAAYRGKTGGAHGGMWSPGEFEQPGEALLAALGPAWEAGVFLPVDGRLCAVEKITIDPQGRRRARLRDLMGDVTRVAVASALVPDDVLPGRVHLRVGETLTASLHPWCLFRAEDRSEQVLLLSNWHGGTGVYVDYCVKDLVYTRDLADRLPDLEKELEVVFGAAPDAQTARSRRSGDKKLRAGGTRRQADEAVLLVERGPWSAQVEAFGTDRRWTVAAPGRFVLPTADGAVDGALELQQALVERATGPARMALAPTTADAAELLQSALSTEVVIDPTLAARLSPERHGRLRHPRGTHPRVGWRPGCELLRLARARPARTRLAVRVPPGGRRATAARVGATFDLVTRLFGPGYLTLLNLDPLDDLYVVAPFDRHAPRVAGDVRVPDEGHVARLRFGGPPGEEVFLALVTPEPLGLEQRDERVPDATARQLLQRLAAAETWELAHAAVRVE